MPRAGVYKDFDARETDVASRYVVARLSILTPQSKVLHEGDLVNMAIEPSQVREDGSMQLFVDADGKVPHQASAEWVGVLNPHASTLQLVKAEDLVRIVGIQTNVPVSVRHVGNGWACLTFNAAWARMSLFKKTMELGKDQDSYTHFRTRELAGPEQFVHLHAHSMYSFLDGVPTPEQMVERAVHCGQPGLALTDHGNGWGLFKFYKACREAEIKPLMGIEFYLVDSVDRSYGDSLGSVRRFEYHTTVIAQNQVGWQNLCKLASLGHAQHFYHVPRIDHKLLLENSEGLIVTSGCFKGPVAAHLQNYNATPQGTQPILDAKGRPVLRYDPDHARAIMRAYKKHLGDRYYIEAQNIDFPRYMQAMPELVTMAKEEGIKVVLTNDCHFIEAKDIQVQDMMFQIAKINLNKDRSYNDMGVHYMRDSLEMVQPWHEKYDVSWITPEMVTNTCEVMERCNVHIPLPGDDDFVFLFPDYDVEKDVDWEAYQQSKGAAS